MVVLGVGNILQKDDGVGVYASLYLKKNYRFSKEIEIIDGGVEGINLFNIFEQNKNILILDSIRVDDTPSSIYLIPSKEILTKGLKDIATAHDIGVLNCLDMLELQGKNIPKVDILGIIPHHITFDINLSNALKESFDNYIKVALNFIKKEGIEAKIKSKTISLEEIIYNIRRV
jgi:hydrogenase maturation protease